MSASAKCHPRDAARVTAFSYDCSETVLGSGIIEYHPYLAFVLAAELAHFQRTRLCRGFPVHMARRILRHILADAIQVVAASAGKRFEFAGNQRAAPRRIRRSVLPAGRPMISRDNRTRRVLVRKANGKRVARPKLFCWQRPRRGKHNSISALSSAPAGM